MLRECFRLGFKPSDICGNRMTKDICSARLEIYYTLFTECPHLSLPYIGNIIGGRDHTTIISGIRRHCYRIGITYDDAIRIRVRNAFAFGVKCSSIHTEKINREKFQILMNRYASVMESAYAAQR